MAAEINNYVGDNFLQYFYIVDSTYSIKAVIDIFSDFLWTERYYGYGEFEITMPTNSKILDICHIDDYIMIRESNKVMVIETIGTHSDAQNGDSIVISGRSLESLLERRVVLDKTIGTIDKEGKPSPIPIQTAIKTMITNNIISPTDSNRQIKNFIFKDSTNGNITSLTMESFSDRGVNLYDKILDICKSNNIGFKVDPVTDGGYCFELYFGINRTWDQTEVPAVVFSESYENINSIDYLSTNKDYKSTVYMEWDWESKQESADFDDQEQGTDITEVYLDTNKSGLSRRESYSRDSYIYEIGIDKNKTAAINQIKDKGKEYLSDYKTTEFFEGEINPYRQFIYGRDYILGDIVQVEDKHGHIGKCRVTEIIRSRDSSGPMLVPTFEKIEGDD